MTAHPLDRPIWQALTGRQAPFAGGDDRALRFTPDVSPFAATRDDSPESLGALAALISPGASVVLLQAGEIIVPPGVIAEKMAPGVQMIAGDLAPIRTGPQIIALGDSDAAEMLALATLTEPGPFLARTNRFGGFCGIREQGRLVAMAGERLKPDGFTEVSGVCTHPDARGRGYAGLLSLAVAHRIVARGEIPFLHAYAANVAAIGLYAALGFVLRTSVTVAVLARPPS